MAMNEPTWTNEKKFKFRTGSGTPGTLRQAIKNGLEDIKLHPDFEPDMIMWIHIRECIAQKFVFSAGKAMEHLSDARATWNRIFPEDKR